MKDKRYKLKVFVCVDDVFLLISLCWLLTMPMRLVSFLIWFDAFDDVMVDLVSNFFDV